MADTIDYKKELEKEEEECGPPDSECGPACSCNTPPTGSWKKSVVVVVVLAAAAAVLVAKLGGPARSSQPVEQASQRSSGVAEVASVKTGDSLTRLQQLNDLAADQDAVLVLFPKGAGDGLSEAIWKATAASRDKLQAQGMTVGIYQLAVDSEDFPAIAARHSLPGVLVLSRSADRPLISGDTPDAAMLTGTVTESRILQAYVAASLAAGGGGCNCAQGATCGGN